MYPFHSESRLFDLVQRSWTMSRRSSWVISWASSKWNQQNRIKHDFAPFQPRCRRDPLHALYNRCPVLLKISDVQNFVKRKSEQESRGKNLCDPSSDEQNVFCVQLWGGYSAVSSCGHPPQQHFNFLFLSKWPHFRICNHFCCAGITSSTTS